MKQRIKQAYLPFLLLVSLLAGCAAGDYQLKGKLTNAPEQTLELVNANTQELKVVDSAQVNANGEFEFKKPVSEKGFYYLRANKQNFAILILSPQEKVTVEADFKNLADIKSVKGSEDCELFVTFNKQSQSYAERNNRILRQKDSLINQFQSYANILRDSMRVDSLSKVIEPQFQKLVDQETALTQERSNYAKEFIAKHPNSFANLAVLQMIPMEENIGIYEKVITALKKQYPTIKQLDDFAKYVADVKVLAIGAVAPEIKLNNPNGQPVALSSLRGKVVLIDFWASWCGPCRAENPNVVRLYNQYKNKGFEVFGVSLDKDKNAWIQAIQKDKLTWTHVSDLGYWNSSVVQLYRFNSIPLTYLIDREGKIIAKNLRGPQLEMKLAEIFSK